MKRLTFFAWYALPILMIIFFLVPFALRGARFSLESMKNDVKDWLPDEFIETDELAWFGDHFLGEQFVVVSWDPTLKSDGTPNNDGCTKGSERYELFLKKLTYLEKPPSVKRAEAIAKQAKEDAAKDKEPSGDAQPTNETTAKDPAQEALRKFEGWDRPADFIGDRWGFYTTDNFHEEWGSNKEKWFKGYEIGEAIPNGKAKVAKDKKARLQKSEHWYYITPDGDIYRWDGGNSLLQAVARQAGRFYTGHNKATGTLITPVDDPRWSEDGPWYYEDPRRLNARMFKTVHTGPDVLRQLTEKGGPLDPDRVEDGDKIAAQRLAGTLFGPDGKRTCVVITLTDFAKRDLRNVLGRELLGRPRGTLLNLAKSSGIDPQEFHMGGPPVDNVAIDEEGQITLANLIIWCVILGLGISYICFRSISATIMVFFVGGISAVVSLAIVQWTGSSLDAVLMSMPAVVYVLGLSGAIHIVNYYRDAVKEDGLIGASESAVSKGFKPCVLAAVTTAVGLASLYTSEILPIRKFGVFSALGVLATLVLLFTYLPAALQIWPLKPRVKKEKGPRVVGALSNLFDHCRDEFCGWIIRRHAWVVAGSLVAIVIFGIGLTRINTSVQLLKMFDGDAKIIRDYAWLETHLGRLVPMELVVRVTPELQRPPSEKLRGMTDEQRKEARFQLTFLERIEATSIIQNAIEEEFGEKGQAICGNAFSAATFAPPLPKGGKGLGNYAERSGLNAALQRRRDDMLTTDYFRVDKHDDCELWRISLRLGALNDVDYGDFVRHLKSVVEPVVNAYKFRDDVLHKIDEKTAGGTFSKTKVLVLGHSLKKPAKKSKEIDQSTLFATTLNRLLSEMGIKVGGFDPTDPKTTPFTTSDDWAKYLAGRDCVVLLEDHPDFDVEFIKKNAGASFVDARNHKFDPLTMSTPYEGHFDGKVAGLPPPKENVTVVYTGVVPLVYKAQRTLLESLKVSIFWAFGLIALVMIVLLRSPTAGMASMLPNMFPVVIIFGALGWSGIPVDIGTMMTASVAMGVAVDDTIHFLTWFRWGLNEGLSRKESIREAYRRVSTAMIQTTAIAGLGMAVFALSTFTPTQKFGYLMLFLLAAALVGDLIFLPAILAGPAGRVFSPSAKRRKSGKKQAESEAIDSDVTEPVILDISKTATAETDAQTGPGDQESGGAHAPPHTGASSKTGSMPHSTYRRDKPHR